MNLNLVNAEAHTVAVLTLVLYGTLVTIAITTVRAIGREDQWQIAACSYRLSELCILELWQCKNACTIQNSIASCEHCHMKKAPQRGRVIKNLPSECCFYHGYSTFLGCFCVDTGHERVLVIWMIKNPLFKVVSSVRSLLQIGVEVCPSTAPIH